MCTSCVRSSRSTASGLPRYHPVSQALHWLNAALVLAVLPLAWVAISLPPTPAKGRPSFNPLIVHVPDLAAAEALAVFDNDARALAATFWPGPLTLVLPLRDAAPIASLVTAGLDTVAIRVPAGRAMRDLLAATGKPLAAPSANRSNGLSPTRAEHVLSSLGDVLVIDDGACAAGLESTIVRGRDVLRPGPITAEMVATALSLLHSSPRTSSGVHRAARATPTAPVEPWTPEQVRGDDWDRGIVTPRSRSIAAPLPARSPDGARG